MARGGAKACPSGLPTQFLTCPKKREAPEQVFFFFFFRANILATIFLNRYLDVGRKRKEKILPTWPNTLKFVKQLPDEIPSMTITFSSNLTFVQVMLINRNCTTLLECKLK